MGELPDYARQNRSAWDGWAADYVKDGETNWRSDEPKWGIWGIPESQAGMFPVPLEGKDAIELGCGTAYVCAWMARRGARVVGIDNSEQQLATARRLQREHRLEFPLLHGNAEALPFPDASFDFAISEYGACLWAAPYRWIPEAGRLLRPGGWLTFMTNSWLLHLCSPERSDEAVGERLLRSGFGPHRVQFADDDGIEFHLAHGELVRLLRKSGFEIEDLVELRPPENATTRYTFVTLEWARKWPCEEVWKVRKT